MHLDLGRLAYPFLLLNNRVPLLKSALIIDLVNCAPGKCTATDKFKTYRKSYAIQYKERGHIFIVICALYGILVYRLRFVKRDLYISLSFVTFMAALAIVCNFLFRKLFNWEPNYFYLFNYKGTPLKFLYTAFPYSAYGWFEITWFYTLVLLLVFLCVFIGLYFVAKSTTQKLTEENLSNR